MEQGATKVLSVMVRKKGQYLEYGAQKSVSLGTVLVHASRDAGAVLVQKYVQGPPVRFRTAVRGKRRNISLEKEQDFSHTANT